MAPAVGVFHAAAWVFSHGTEVSWASLGIVVPDSSLLPEIEQLRRLQSRGVRMGTITQAENARHFDRVLLAYRPDAATLARAEALEEARVVIAIGDARPLCGTGCPSISRCIWAGRDSPLRWAPRC